MRLRIDIHPNLSHRGPASHEPRVAEREAIPDRRLRADILRPSESTGGHRRGRGECRIGSRCRTYGLLLLGAPMPRSTRTGRREQDWRIRRRWRGLGWRRRWRLCRRSARTSRCRRRWRRREVSSGGLEDVAGEFLNNLAGMPFDRGGHDPLNIDIDGVPFEVAVSDQQQAIAGLELQRLGSVVVGLDAKGGIGGDLELRPLARLAADTAGGDRR